MYSYVIRMSLVCGFTMNNGIQKVLISGLLTTNPLAQNFIEDVNKVNKNMCYIEGYFYINNDICSNLDC